MDRIGYEKQTIEKMIRLYCRHSEGNRSLCDGCRELLEYARMRLDTCRYGNGKTACGKCTTHCYEPNRRKKIRAVMKYAGPRMILYHPIAAIRHLIHR